MSAKDITKGKSSLLSKVTTKPEGTDMDITLANIVLVVGGVLTALHAGLLYDFSVDIVPALRSIKGAAHIAMMQAINTKIENPVFFLSFFGPILLLPLATVLHWGEPQFGWLLAASVIQIFGCEAVTVAGNIPLNNKLAKIEADKLSEAEADKIRTDFQGPGTPWMRFHTLRTLAAITATTIVFVVCLSK
jgi:uncharacterized membrane protein